MPRFVSLGLALVLFVSAGSVSAQDSLEKQVSLLKSSEDFRVRTQAALSLGASANKKAVEPLCQALVDQNRTVRIAVASALGRLQQGGKECVAKRIAVESDASVKASLQRALERLGGVRPGIDGSTRYYVAIGPIANDSNAESAPDRVTRGFIDTAKELGGYAFAPDNEALDQAKTLLKKHPSVRGFYLSPKVAKPKYQGGNLTITLSVAMLSYPDKVMLGHFSVKLTQEGVSSPDPAAEEELVSLAAESALKKFAKHIPQL